MTDITKRKLICPACQTGMEKIFVEECGCYVDICADGCGGIYFDNRELERFDEKHENIDTILKAIEGKKFIKVDESQKRICPACGAPMVKNYASKKHEIEIDCCYSCGGKFLDNGELQAIRKEYDTENERGEDFNKSFKTQFEDAVDFEKAEERAQKIEEERKQLKKFLMEEFLNWKNDN